MAHQGDIGVGDIIDFTFTTVASTGGPASLLGTPVVSIFKDNIAVPFVTGVTLTVDLNGVVGLNQVRVDTSQSVANFVPHASYSIVITTGTVNGVSVVGYTVGNFSIAKRLTGVLESGIITAATATTATLRAAYTPPNGALIGATIVIRAGTGLNVRRVITANTGNIITVDTWTVNPDTTSQYDIYGTAPGSIVSPAPVNLLQLNGVAAAAANLATAFTAGPVANVNATQLAGIAAAAGNLATAFTASAVANVNITQIAGSGVAANNLNGAFVAGAVIAVNTQQIGGLAAPATNLAAAFASNYAEETGTPASNAPLYTKLNWMFMKSKNTVLQTASSQVLKANNGTTTVSTAAVSDDGTTATRGIFT